VPIGVGGLERAEIWQGGVPNRLACQKFGKPEPSMLREHQFKEIKEVKEVASIPGASMRNAGRTPVDREVFNLNPSFVPAFGEPIQKGGRD
jgi:hypothetical protein